MARLALFLWCLQQVLECGYHKVLPSIMVYLHACTHAHVHSTFVKSCTCAHTYHRSPNRAALAPMINLATQNSSLANGRYGTTFSNATLTMYPNLRDGTFMIWTVVLIV